MTGILLSDQRKADPPPPEELEVMRLCVAGLKDVAIAHRLDVSVVTVRRRANSFRRRLGAQNRLQAVAIATRLGWLSGATPTDTNLDFWVRNQQAEREHKSSGGGGE